MPNIQPVDALQRGAEVGATFLSSPTQRVDFEHQNFARQAEFQQAMQLADELAQARPQQSFLESIDQLAQNPEDFGQRAVANVDAINTKIVGFEKYKTVNSPNAETTNRNNRLIDQLQGLRTTVRGAEIVRLQTQENLTQQSLNDPAIRKDLVTLLGVNPKVSDNDLWQAAMGARTDAQHQLQDMGLVKLFLGDVDMKVTENRAAVETLSNAILADPDIQSALLREVKQMTDRLAIPDAADLADSNKMNERIARSLDLAPAAIRGPILNVIRERNTKIDNFLAQEKQKLISGTEANTQRIVERITDNWMAVDRDKANRRVNVRYGGQDKGETMIDDMVTVMYDGPEKGMKQIITRQIRAQAADFPGLELKDAQGQVTGMDQGKLNAIVDQIYSKQGLHLRKFLVQSTSRANLGSFLRTVRGEKRFKINGADEAALFGEAFGDSAMLDALRNDITGDPQALSYLKKVVEMKNIMPRSKWSKLLMIALLIGAGGLLGGVLAPGGLMGLGGSFSPHIGPALDGLASFGAMIPHKAALIGATAATAGGLYADKKRRENAGGYTPVTAKIA